MPRRRLDRSLVLLAVLAGCGPKGDGDESTGTTAASTTTAETSTPTTSESSGSGSSSAGEALCGFTVGAGEPMDPDPDGCYAITSEPGCEAMAEQMKCTGLFGNPVTCDDAGLCITPAVFLGCRPFVICKRLNKLVCRVGAAGEVEAFLTPECVPEGFGLCDPQPASLEPEPPFCE